MESSQDVKRKIFYYDPDGNQVPTIDNADQSVTCVYDSDGNLISASCSNVKKGRK